MKKFFQSIGLALLASAFVLYFAADRAARSGVSCSVPNTFSNGTTADATQVNANFAALVACFTNTAEAGANSSITALTGLTTPLTPAQGGTTVYVGGTSVGTNTITLATPVPAGFALQPGSIIYFTLGATNTGPVTLAIGANAAKNVLRQVPLPIGNTGFAGGEWLSGGTAVVYYDGTQFIAITNFAHGVPGSIMDYAAAGCPTGWSEANGGTVVAANFAALNTVLGTLWGSSASNVVLPDLRGAYTVSREQGGSGRLAGATTCTALGTGTSNCSGVGAATYTSNPAAAFDAIALTQARLPSGALSGSSAGFTASNSIAGHIPTGSAAWSTGGWTDGATVGAKMAAASTVTDVNGYTPTGTVGSVNLNGSASPFSVMGNVAVVTKCVKL